MPSQKELRVQNLMQERDDYRSRHELRLADMASRQDPTATEDDRKLLRELGELAASRDEEITELISEIERDRAAEEQSRKIRRAMVGAVEGVDSDDEGVVYRSFAAYARDEILTRDLKFSAAIGQRLGAGEVEAARARIQLLKRTPANTLSSNVGGLIPDQHIAQIFQTIDRSRPLVASAFRTTLERGQLTFPKITTRPVVAVQASEKTEAGNTGMVVGMETATASTYLGGGDLSWQAINWSTPDALGLWFDLAAADYALKTEQDAGEVIQSAAFLNDVGTLFGATGTYAEFIAAVALGISDVYSNSGEMADTLYLAPDRAAYLLGLTSSTPAMFANASLSFAAGSGNVVGLNVVISRGLDSGVIAVGVARHLIVAETAGAPVELRVVEPAIGGVEVGIIGAFEAVVAQDESFALLTAAS